MGRIATATLLALAGIPLIALHAPVQQAIPLSADPDGVLQAFESHSRLAQTSPFASLRWQFLGPTNLSGRANDIAVADRRGGRRIYVAYATGGLWKTDDAGATWQPVLTNAADISIHAIAVAPSNPDVVWAGTGAGLYKSTDAARTWSPMGLAGTRTIWRIRVHPANPDVVYVAAQGPAFDDSDLRGVFKTSDGGKTWARSLNRGTRAGASDLVMDPRDPSTLYAATYEKVHTLGGFAIPGTRPDLNQGSIWKTVDAGTTWTEAANGLPSSSVRGRIGIDVSRSDPSVLYALVDSWEVVQAVRPGELTPVNTPLLGHYRGYELFRTADGGRSWRRTNSGPISSSEKTALGIGDDFGQLRIDPQDSDRVYVLDLALGISKDGGATFVSGGVSHADHHGFWIDPEDPGHLYDCTDGGAYSSGDRGMTWKSMLVPTTQLHTVALDMGVPARAYISVQDQSSVRRAIDLSHRDSLSAGEFEVVPSGEHTNFVFDPANQNVVFANGWNLLSRLVRVDLSDPSRPSRVSIQPPAELADSPVRTTLELPFVGSRHSPTTLYAGYQYLVRSRDRGDHWERISEDLTDNNGSLPFQPRHAFQAISAIGESPKRTGLLYVGTDDGHLHVTHDDGKTWQELTTNLPRRAQISSVTASAFREEVVYVTQGRRGAPEWLEADPSPAWIYRSTDYGRTFRSVAGNLPTGPAYLLREDPVNPRVLYVGTGVGVYVSTSGGARWEVLGGNLPTVPVRDLQIHPRDHLIVIATWGRGLWAMDALKVRPK